jgi:hypothetical protein
VAIRNLITSDIAPTGAIYDVNRLTTVTDMVLKPLLIPPPSRICHESPWRVIDIIRRIIERRTNQGLVLDRIDDTFPTPTYKYIYRIYATPPTPTIIAELFFNKLATNINI